jgi:hypothetical protein
LSQRPQDARAIEPLTLAVFAEVCHPLYPPSHSFHALVPILLHPSGLLRS